MKFRKTPEELKDSVYATRLTVAVDENDIELNNVPLIEAHREPGIKHRAFSLVLYRERGGKKEILLQKRAEEKPVFCHFWANTCCYNMVPGEDYLERAAVRVREEMGVKINSEDLKILYRFSYHATDMEGWCENELDSVIIGKYEGEVIINPHEAEDYRWIEWAMMKEDMEKNPGIYAPWWNMIVNDGRLEKFLNE